MVAAIAAVRGGLSVRAAARQFNVPKTTLLYKIRGVYPEARKMGPGTIFSIDEEQLLAKWVLDMAKAGFPVTKENFLISVSRLANELKKEFPSGKPGLKWYVGFLKRHSEISIRVAQNLTRSRSEVTTIKLQSWFQEVENYLKKSGESDVLTHPDRIFNSDESAFFFKPEGFKGFSP